MRFDLDFTDEDKKKEAAEGKVKNYLCIFKVYEKDAFVIPNPYPKFDESELKKGGFYYNSEKKWLYIGYKGTKEGENRVY